MTRQSVWFLGFFSFFVVTTSAIAEEITPFRDSEALIDSPVESFLASDPSDSLGFGALKMIAMLSLVIVFAYLVLHKGLGSLMQRQRSGQRIKIKERVSLDSKNALFIVEIDGISLLLSSSDRGVHLVLPDNLEGPKEVLQPKESAFSIFKKNSALG